MNKKELQELENMINANKNENANVIFSNNYIELEFNNYIQKKILEMEFNKYDEELYKLHVNGDVHYHDLGFGLTRMNCLQHPIYKIFEKGLDALGCKSKPAKHLDTALSHCLNALSLGQAHFAGGQSIPMFNVFIAPFCKDMDEKEIRQCIQQFLFQANQISPSRGLQTIFMSLNFNFKIPDWIKDKPVKYKEGKFGDYEKELKIFTKIFIEELNKGDGSGKPFAFPNCIFYLEDEDVDMELMELVVKNMVEKSNTYIINGLKYGKRLGTSMGCRTWLDDNLTNEPFVDVFGTGNLTYTTINLPRLFLKHIDDKENLITNVEYDLNDLIEKIVKAMLIRRKIVWNNWKNGLYPFVKNPLYKNENGYYYYNIGMTTMSIGIIGISDIKKICKYYNIEFDEYEFVEMIRSKIDELNNYTYLELAEKYGIDDYEAYDIEYSRWSLIGSPAESCSEKFKKLDNKIYGDILKEVGLYEKKYYTNSIFVDEETSITGHQKLMYEQQFHPLLNAGIICHIFNAGIPKNNDYKSLSEYFIKICKHTNVRYFTISNVIVHCKNCNKSYVGNKNEDGCKFCKSKDIELFQKITGYLTPVKNYNKGKFCEFERRNEFKL